MAYQRECVPAGKTVVLRAIFLDGCGEPTDPDTDTIQIYIYDNNTSTSDLDDAIEALDFSNARATITSVTKITTGFYEVTYTISISGETGTWHDVWYCTIGGVASIQYFSIQVDAPLDIQLQVIGNNTLIVVTLSEDITDEDGNTLGSEQYITFSTTYSPYYASPELLRLECGSWLNGIPDDTLSLMIHWSSLEADVITGLPNSNSSVYNMARTKFVVYDAALRCLALPANIGGKTKQLADLMIKNDSSFDNVMRELKTERDQWYRVVNAGGSILPGQSFAPAVAVKGILDPDRPKIGRLWLDPRDYNYAQPTHNRKVLPYGHLRWKSYFLDN